MFWSLLFSIFLSLSRAATPTVEVADGSPEHPYEFGVAIPLRDGLKLGIAYSSHLGTVTRITPAVLHQILPNKELYVMRAEWDSREYELVYTMFIDRDHPRLYVTEGCLRVRVKDLICVGDEVLDYKNSDRSTYKVLGFSRMPRRRGWFDSEKVTVAALNRRLGDNDYFVAADHLVRRRSPDKDN